MVDVLSMENMRPENCVISSTQFHKGKLRRHLFQRGCGLPSSRRFPAFQGGRKRKEPFCRVKLETEGRWWTASGQMNIGKTGGMTVRSLQREWKHIAFIEKKGSVKDVLFWKKIRLRVCSFVRKEGWLRWCFSGRKEGWLRWCFSGKKEGWLRWCRAVSAER